MRELYEYQQKHDAALLIEPTLDAEENKEFTKAPLSEDDTVPLLSQEPLEDIILSKDSSSGSTLPFSNGSKGSSSILSSPSRSSSSKSDLSYEKLESQSSLESTANSHPKKPSTGAKGSTSLSSFIIVFTDSTVINADEIKEFLNPYCKTVIIHEIEYDAEEGFVSVVIDATDLDTTKLRELDGVSIFENKKAKLWDDVYIQKKTLLTLLGNS